MKAQNSNFRKLHNNIMIGVVILSLWLTTFICVLSCILIYNTMYKNFESFSLQNTKQQVQGFNSYLSVTSSSMSFFSENKNIITILESNNNDYAVNLSLQTLMGTLRGVSSVAFLTNQDTPSYAYGKISNYPTYENLSSNKNINEFIMSNEISYVSVRTDNIATNYNHHKYPKELGVISIIKKTLSSDGKLLGILVADILPSTIYTQFFSNFPVTLINQATSISNSNKNTNPKHLVLNHATKINGNLYIYKPITNDCKIIVKLTLDNFNKSFGILLLVEIVIFVSMNLFAYVIAKVLSKSTITPLEQLTYRFRNQKLKI